MPVIAAKKNSKQPTILSATRSLSLCENKVPGFVTFGGSFGQVSSRKRGRLTVETPGAKREPQMWFLVLAQMFQASKVSVNYRYILVQASSWLRPRHSACCPLARSHRVLLEAPVQLKVAHCPDCRWKYGPVPKPYGKVN
ncbi:hypothetical protein CIHG_09496 [Coccidioides immitis H538.4]|uniref:Uncharacterized protein n=3 Tax=Coccidioides immitis TaxID=5501 RepID=A0A0J8QKL4_COCIT|nr:hypothetical protein CIRG_03811 [Coccidioides immitis RMSCC 2394]KMU72965.1 hypothetical protein CISG_09930 [Coccidioides immitis RMSCC 3703]KMU91689.1 hypothetical protein CIHG_09496 [Coccidioides immitis H538.4]